MSLIAGNLGVVQRLLDQHHIEWGVCAGAAAHLYGDRRPIQDIDILIGSGSLQTIVQLLKNAQKAVQFDGQRALWRGIKLFDNITVKRSGEEYPFLLDAPMIAHLRHMPLLGSRVAVLAPEDVMIHKLVMGRGPEQHKHDWTDAAAIVRRQPLDVSYLEKRLRLARAWELVAPKLMELGVTVGEPTLA